MTSTFLSDDSFESNNSPIADDCDSEHEELPTVPTIVGLSPNKAQPHVHSEELLHTPTKPIPTEVQGTSSQQFHLIPDIKQTLTASPNVDLNVSSFSPLRPDHQQQRRLDYGHRLAKKTEELAKSIKIKTERNDKLESYKSSGGILALSKEWEEQEQARNEEETIKATTGTTPTSPHPSSLQLPLPVNPPGRRVFTHPPSFIEELYPPGWDEVEGTVESGTNTFSDVEKHLMTQQNPDALKEVICNEWIKLCYEKKTCPRSIWQWLFQIMCRSRDYRLARSAWKNLDALVKLALSHNENTSIYTPSLSDVEDILFDFGADKTRLLETTVETDPMEVDESNESDKQNVDVPLRNLSLFLSYLNFAIMTNNPYTVGEAVSLILLLVRLTLDPHLVGECIASEILQCVAVLVQSIPEEHWDEVATVLVSRIAAVSGHHHDMLYLTVFFGGGAWKRVRVIQKKLAKKFIEILTLINNNEQCAEVDEEKEKSHTCTEDTSKECLFVLQVVGHYRTQETHAIDYYEMYSIMSMLALFMHPSEMVWPSVEMRKQVATQLGLLSSGKIRDNPNHPERGPVKDLVIRMKLELSVQKVSSQKQQDLFSYGR